MTNTTSAVDQVAMPAPSVREQRAFVLPGGLMALLGIILLGGGVAVGLAGIGDQNGLFIGTAVGLLLIGFFVLAGLIMVQPREARVIQFLGRYTGTVRQDGLRWVNPLTSRTKVSTRIRNHETTVLKVNDAGGSPIEIAAVVVWHVEDSARAMFEVDSFVRFVQTQTETAVRHIATSYPYDSDDPTSTSLRENAEDITEQLSTEIGVRVESAGVRVIESRLTHLAYAPEIAQAMLQRQQAGAVVAARTRIVEGAVGMVEMALDKIAEQGVVELDEERKAAMVSNLLVVLCGDRSTQPVVNTGSLYH
ncbi:regulator of protease activity HflC (stomatin/prohibitin superfamily) [Actinoalloteichus hoggarensis]|uniref:SPFH domain / Band 7 family protein n=1 Tax=Actinoalloteichus hoggarensis TaxID=1470176 RepID=A0A221W0B6_9PSEU|nr:SPFH domain-containing protein [Actinoalloteichus hoggarensis]ASO19207.1 SPFH domain / Band 7 family protein [Actinoalloteichus hoggarensis]MBB5920444.1 regulator of protease activity HflC (stomatin/prohibitin superfamily) [Actinoalloteichus hoggarensis]